MLVDGGGVGRVVEGVPLVPLVGERPRWAWLPAAPRLSGAPLQVLREPPDHPDSGGILTLSVDVGWPDEVLAAVRRVLTEETGDPDALAGPVVARDVTAEVSVVTRVATEAPRFLTPLAEVRPDLAAPHRASLLARLDRLGLEIVEASLGAAGSPILVRYLLGFDALVAGRRLIATVDWGRVYDHVSEHSRVGMLLVVGEVRSLVERLVESRAVQITAVEGETSAGDGSGGGLQDALAWVEEIIVERCCTPMLELSRQPATASLGSAGELFGIGADAAVRDLRQVERTTVRYDLSRARVVRRVQPSQALLVDLVTDPAAVFVDPTLSDPAFFRRMTVRIGAVQALSTYGIAEILGTWRWGSTSVSFRLGPDATEAVVSAWQDASPDGRWSVEMDVRFGPDAPVAAGALIHLPVTEGRDRFLRLELERLLGLRHVEVRLPLAIGDVVVARAELWRTRGEVRESLATITLQPKEQPVGAVWIHDVVPQDRITVVPTWMLSTGAVWTGEPIDAESAIVALPPAEDAWNVQVISEHDWVDLDKVVVAVAALPDGAPTVLHYTGPDQSHAVRLTAREPGARRCRYTVTRTWTDGRVEEDPPVETDLTVLLVGRIAGSVLQVEFRPVGPELPQAGLRAIEVDAVYVDVANQYRVEDRTVIQAVAQRWTWTVELRDPSFRRYSYRCTWHRLDGRSEVGPWIETGDRLIPLVIH